MDALRAAQKTRTEDHIGAAIKDRLEELAVITRIVFEVGVLNKNDVAGDFSESAAQRSAFPLILCLKQDPQVAEVDEVGAIESRGERFARILELDHFLENLASAVSRTVIDEDNLFTKLCFDDAAQDFVDGGFLVVNGNDDGQLGIDKSEWVVTRMRHRKFREQCKG